jgi:hypothetical protein
METTNSYQGMEMDLKAAGNVSGEHETSQQLQIVSGGEALGWRHWSTLHVNATRAPHSSTCPYAMSAKPPYRGIVFV